MHRILRAAGVIWLVALVFQLNVTTQTGITSANFVNFEGAQTNPIRLSPDGMRLFAVNTPDARLSVFELAETTAPHLTHPAAFLPAITGFLAGAGAAVACAA